MWILFAFLAVIALFVGIYVSVLNAASRGTETLKKPTRGWDFLRGLKDSFTDENIAHIQKETQWKQAVATYEDVDGNIDKARVIAQQQHAIQRTQNTVQLRLGEAAIRVTEDAMSAGLPAPVHEQVLLSQAQADIEVEKHSRMLEANVHAKAAEAQLDINTALTVALKDKHQVLQIQDELLELMERAYAIKTSNKPEELKQAQLEVVGAVIDGFRRDLRELQNLPGDNRPRLPRVSEEAADD